jgi:hypothetical protein
MQALVSSRYVVIEYVAPRCGWLLAASRHETIEAQAVQLREPLGYVREHRLEEDSTPGAADSDAISFEPELARQAHGLTSPVLEQLGSDGHGTSPGIYP